MSAIPRVIAFGMGGNKFRNKPTVVDGIRFHSKREVKRHQALQLLERNGEVRDIRRQVSYRIDVNGKHICRYIADFVYEERHGDDWQGVVEDVKGYQTDTYKLKKRLMKAVHGIEIRET